MKELHFAGANSEAKNKLGETALIVASKEGNKDVVEFLVSKQVNLEATDIYGNTALLKAIQQNNISIVKCLHLAGANICNKGRKLFPIMDAIHKGYLEIVKYLASKLDLENLNKEDQAVRLL